MKFEINNLRKVRQIKRNKEQDFIKKKLEIENIIKKEEVVRKIKDAKVLSILSIHIKNCI